MFYQYDKRNEQKGGTMGQIVGLDLGSSFVKGALLDADSGRVLARSGYPDGEEMPIDAPEPGWAEQNPDAWWAGVVSVVRSLLDTDEADPDRIRGIGIAYQMHGLVVLDKHGVPVRPAVIWCDSRAVETGREAFRELGETYCLRELLNSPGNFTASKLRWVRENEPDRFREIETVMLPGDYLAWRMTGVASTTRSGLSEMILWNAREGRLANKLLTHYGIPERMIPPANGSFETPGVLTETAARELGLPAGVPVTYRAGDQPNNALALGAMQPGEVAATAGTSGVLYGVTDQPLYDRHSRVNTFVHVNHTVGNPRYGVLLCINGAGSQYAWLRRQMGWSRPVSYDTMNQMAATVAPGSDGLVVLPFGNGAERVLENAQPGGMFTGLDFQRHAPAHTIRAAQEGIAFSMVYGCRIMQRMGLEITHVRAARANLFLSPVFRESFRHAAGVELEIVDTDGAVGAARGAAVGAGLWSESDLASRGLPTVDLPEGDPDPGAIRRAYGHWESVMRGQIHPES